MHRNLLILIIATIILYGFMEYNCFTMNDYLVFCPDELCEFTYCKDQWQTPLFRIFGK